MAAAVCHQAPRRATVAVMIRRRDARGSVTAETAVVLPVLVLLLTFSLWGLGVLSAQLRCVEAAHVGARAAARGEPATQVRRVVGDAAGSGSVVVVDVGDRLVVVSVTRRVVPPWPGLARLVPAVTVRASSTAALEPGEAP